MCTVQEAAQYAWDVWRWTKTQTFESTACMHPPRIAFIHQREYSWILAIKRISVIDLFLLRCHISGWGCGHKNLVEDSLEVTRESFDCGRSQECSWTINYLFTSLCAHICVYHWAIPIVVSVYSVMWVRFLFLYICWFCFVTLMFLCKSCDLYLDWVNGMHDSFCFLVFTTVQHFDFNISYWHRCQYGLKVHCKVLIDNSIMKLDQPMIVNCSYHLHCH